jgi:hypothetical protein
MGKAWKSGASKPVHERYPIYRSEVAGVMQYHRLTDNGLQPLARSFAEHEVCSGAARYVNGNGSIT